jgi:branched-chain amino acid transport system substrate-binding protein
MQQLKTFLAALVLFLSSCKKDTPQDNQSIQTIRIGGLFSITGNWSTLGKTSREAMNLALVDVNEYMEQRGSRYRFSTVNYDTKLNPTEATNAIKSGFTNSGVKIFIGPQSSAEVTAVKDYANNNNLLVISQGSTASSLAIPNDAIFRYCPGDGVEGLAIANSMFASGKRAVITMARNDVGNIGLQNSVGTNFFALGGQVDAIAPFGTEVTEFTSLLATLKPKIEQYSTSLGADKVAVYLASFDRATDIFRAASADPVFASVNWYGGDGIVKSEVLRADAVACDFAITTKFFAPDFGLPLQPHPQLANIAGAIKTNTGIEADAYAFSVYDIMWVIARTIANYPEVLNDFSKMKTLFSKESEKYFGISGPTLLNANGDRAIGSFDYWGIVKEGTEYKWKVVGKSQ